LGHLASWRPELRIKVQQSLDCLPSDELPRALLAEVLMAAPEGDFQSPVALRNLMLGVCLQA